MDWLKKWWFMTPEEEKNSQDAVYTRVLPNQRRGTLGLFVFAVAFAYTVTGFAVAADMLSAASSSAFWMDMVIGYGALAIIAFVTGYPSYKTGCNTTIFFRYTFGSTGGAIPNLLIAFLLLGFSGFQTATIGEVLFPMGTWQFTVVCLIAGLLVIWATVKGIKGLEEASNIAIGFLLLSIVVVLIMSFREIGGISGFNAIINSSEGTKSNAYLINVLLGSWAIGALCSGNFTRYSKNMFSVVGFCFIAFFVVQIVLGLLGATSLITVDSYLFVEYAKKVNTIFYIFCVVAFLLALWTTLNGNIYLSQVPVATHMRGSIRAVGVICGAMAAIMGAFGFSKYISPFLDIVGVVFPPFMGPMVVDYYLHKNLYFYDPVIMVKKMPKWNWAAMLSALAGLGTSLLWKPDWAPAAIWSIVLSVIIYAVLYYALRAAGIKVGLDAALMDDELAASKFKPYEPSDLKDVASKH